MLLQRQAGLLGSCNATSADAHLLTAGTSSHRTRPRTVVRSNYDVDVEAERRPAPDAPPGRWGSAPPPPPPPPPPSQPSRPSGLQAPSRREALFAFLGAGVGTALTTAFFKSNDTPEALAEALDALLEDPEFAELMADEVLYNEYEANVDGLNDKIDDLRNELITSKVEEGSK